MPLPKHYHPDEVEPRLLEKWQQEGIYGYASEGEGPVYAIDTPPATVSGRLHLGHVYSYSHPDFMARYFRMNGYNVYYPMGFDDNGLPTERLVEKRHGIRAAQVGRQAFIEKCLEVSEAAEVEYRALWQRLGLSIDWNYTYRTIDERSRCISQTSFIELYQKGLAYRKRAPTIWCPECRTAIAQAELEDQPRTSEFVTLGFTRESGEVLPVATTRPELLASCVAVFVNPKDERYQALVGQQVTVPLYEQRVPVLADSNVDPEKGSGAVMCCTFGDQADVAWWQTYNLPLVEAIDRQGRMSSATILLAGQPILLARRQIKEELEQAGLLLERQPVEQMLRVHERCDTAVEYIIEQQWFVNVLDHKTELLAAGEQIRWHPEHMGARYRAWVENLSWDWCISRQRYFGVPFPVWYCQACGETITAAPEQLPVDPLTQSPGHNCPACGGAAFWPESDVMDTWATSSLSPQIVCGWLDDPQRYERLFPMTLRPQSHDIIRTWTFYTILKSLYHFEKTPWSDVFISGWGVAGEGKGKISKSRGGGAEPPLEMIQRYSADAVRYWAASTGPGRDAVISEEKVQMGQKLVTKLWNVARFSETFLTGFTLPAQLPDFTPADRWILAAAQALVEQVTRAFESYEYALARTETEGFFWRDLADNYVEMAKQRLYDPQHPQHEGARYALYTALRTDLLLLAPFMPYVTDAIYRELYARKEGRLSIHRAGWPQPDERLEDGAALKIGELLIGIATAVRRYKSEHNLSLGSEIACLQIAAQDPALVEVLGKADSDLMSVTRARAVQLVDELDPALTLLPLEGDELRIGV
ncbi:MAG TPA: valine--tRNA ligase [Levilinea sp.]|nr:valine--tRNA ligase [Levilinea sp.]